MDPKARKLENEVRDYIGHGFIERLEETYRQYKEKPTKTNREKYLLWRLRVRVKAINNPEMLVRLNEVIDAGLFDEEVGPLYDNLDPDTIEFKNRFC